jgi:hypothetical protein
MVLVPQNVTQIVQRDGTPLRTSVRDILDLPLMRERRADAKAGKIGKTKVTKLGLALDPDEYLHLLDRARRRAPGARYLNGWDALAASIVSAAMQPGFNKLQAMKLLVDMVEPLDKPIDIRTPAAELAASLGIGYDELYALAHRIAGGTG